MKAPDKIYIRPMLNPSDGYVGIAWAEAHGGMEEYIRKDALLEWANNMKRICKGAEPIEKAYQTMIDKLNEM